MAKVRKILLLQHSFLFLTRIVARPKEINSFSAHAPTSSAITYTTPIIMLLVLVVKQEGKYTSCICSHSHNIVHLMKERIAKGEGVVCISWVVQYCLTPILLAGCLESIWCSLNQRANIAWLVLILFAYIPTALTVTILQPCRFQMSFILFKKCHESTSIGPRCDTFYSCNSIHLPRGFITKDMPLITGRVGFSKPAPSKYFL